MKSQFAWRQSALIVAVLLGGCRLMPDYQRPASPVAADWPTGPAYKAESAVAKTPAAAAAADIAWRDFFKDERLAKVIELAIANNRDLRVSTLNIEKARAQYGIQRAALLPTVTANGYETAAKVPRSMTGNGNDKISREYDANLAATAYELDFFGRVRSLSEAALQSYLATEEARRAQQISLVAEVAIDYLTLAADQQRVKLANETLASQQQSYDLVKRRFDAGTTSGVALYEAQASVEAARNELLRYTAAVVIDQNALKLVVGSDVPASLLPGDSVGSGPGAVPLSRPGIDGNDRAQSRRRRPAGPAAQRQSRLVAVGPRPRRLPGGRAQPAGGDVRLAVVVPDLQPQHAADHRRGGPRRLTRRTGFPRVRPRSFALTILPPAA